MAILKPGVTPPVSTPTNPNLQPQAKKTVVVDTKLQELRSLITHVEGYAWDVEYFSQYLTQDDESSPLQNDIPEPLQQYLRIQKLELRVTTPLRPTQSPDSGEWTATGTSTVFAGVIPNVGDVFCADVGDGRAGKFRIVLTDRKSLLTQSTFSIDYELVAYIDEVNYADLIGRTVKTVTYLRDFVDIGKTPLLIDSEVAQYEKIREYTDKFIKLYFEKFYSKEYATFLVPEQPQPTYDPFCTKFMRESVDLSTYPFYQTVKLLNCDTEDTPTIRTFWDAFQQRSDTVLDHASLKHDLLSIRSIRVYPKMNAVRYSGLVYLLYPSEATGKLGSSAGVDLAPSTAVTPQRPPLTPYPDAPVDQPVIHPVTVDDYYVLSAAFYQRNTAELSVLESLVNQYFQAEAIDPTRLVLTCARVPLWGLVEQYFYIPILIRLLTAAINDVN